MALLLNYTTVLLAHLLPLTDLYLPPLLRPLPLPFPPTAFPATSRQLPYRALGPSRTPTSSSSSVERTNSFAGRRTSGISIVIDNREQRYPEAYLITQMTLLAMMHRDVHLYLSQTPYGSIGCQGHSSPYALSLFRAKKSSCVRVMTSSQEPRWNSRVHC